MAAAGQIRLLAPRATPTPSPRASSPTPRRQPPAGLATPDPALLDGLPVRLWPTPPPPSSAAAGASRPSRAPPPRRQSSAGPETPDLVLADGLPGCSGRPRPRPSSAAVGAISHRAPPPPPQDPPGAPSTSCCTSLPAGGGSDAPGIVLWRPSPSPSHDDCSSGCVATHLWLWQTWSSSRRALAGAVLAPTA
ncbi:hypothetical protein ACQJBY_052995 [Aegilops geniculata]